MERRIVRTLAVAMAAALVVGSLSAGTAEAKKKKPKPKPKVCAEFRPGALGSGAETTVVADTATEGAPIALTIPTEPGVGLTSPDDPGADTGPTSHVFHNVQVDSKSAVKALFVRIEFPAAFDYDLYMRFATGGSAAYAAGLNQAAGTPADIGIVQGGHSEMGAEQIDGLDTRDCVGWTIDITSAGTPGGDVALLIWLA